MTHAIRADVGDYVVTTIAVNTEHHHVPAYTVGVVKGRNGHGLLQVGFGHYLDAPILLGESWLDRLDLPFASDSLPGSDVLCLVGLLSNLVRLSEINLSREIVRSATRADLYQNDGSRN